MKKLLLILLLCLPVCAQTHTEVTQEDAQTISGNKNFTLQRSRGNDPLAQRCEFGRFYSLLDRCQCFSESPASAL